MELAEGALEAGLRALGYSEFRLGQREAVETLLRDGKLLLVAPTGGGKSLTYQLPGTLLPGTTLVVSPLIALMADQVQALRARGVAATYLASTLDPDEARRRIADVAAGAYRIAYVAPERLAVPSFRRLLAQMECPLLAIDEAHCISEWGHDFRPEYLQLAHLLSELKPQRVLACTATATPVVRDEILARLGLPASTAQHVHGFARPNIALRAVEIESAKHARKLVDAQLEEATGFGNGTPRGAVIIYAPTRRRAEEEAARLRDRGRVDVYHAGLPPGDREHAQRKFSEGALDVIVATNAFGMGIDRSDVRAVVHLAPPSSIEAYYQEVGRAGRDGEPAYGLLLAASSDMALRRRLIERGNGDGIAPNPHIVEHKWQLFLELMRWVEGGACRHDAILRYFGDERETLAGCGRCDVCTAIDENEAVDAEQVSLIVRKALSGVARVHGRFGLNTAAKLLCGVEDERLSRSGLDAVRTFGALRDWPEERVVRLLRRCVSAAFVSFIGDDRPMVVLTEEGLRTMRGERPARLLLPPVQARKALRRDKPAAGTRSGGRQPVVMREGDEALFEALRSHRMQLAKDQGVPPYVIASDRTLRELCTLRPRTQNELLAIHGIGPAKADRYGAGFLQVLTATP
ncbi:MAG TPA: RecQ family ATP-dependent DNA helicase [Polyangiales bacterium]|nr:RecQ family ATP-dependent DNA helicase [Polyangiales bacterium]